MVGDVHDEGSGKRRVLGVLLIGVVVAAVVGVIVVSSGSEDLPESASLEPTTVPELTAEDSQESTPGSASTTSPTSSVPVTTSVATSTTRTTDASTTLVSTTTVVLANGFVGSWSAVDADGSEIAIVIEPDGRFEAVDTSSTGCRNRGLPGGWRWEGAGSFNDDERGPVFTATGSTYCSTADGEDNIANGVTFDFVQQAADQIMFAADGVIYDRVTTE
jgi:hypothetical protein